MTYSEKLKDPRWQKKRLEIFQRDDFKCQKCGSREQTLHVHHRFYFYGKDPWDYPNEVLVTLCSDCHEEEEVFKYRQKDFINTFLSAGFFNTDLELLGVMICGAINNLGISGLDFLLTRLAISEEFREDLVNALEVERIRINNKQEPKDSENDLPF